MAEKNYLVAGSRPWSRRAFDEAICKLPGRWTFIGSKDELTAEHVAKIAPRYIFFLHWSWIVPPEIVRDFECVCFHMTDVPYGRGGSPLQNLIIRGHTETKLTALRMTDEIDAGPVYFKEELSLEGNAEEIFLRANFLAAKMIERIVREEPRPVLQTGEPVLFKRRKPEESRIVDTGSLEKFYDFIRMLDADGYPRAFIDAGNFRMEFSRAALNGDRIDASVTIRRREGNTT